VSVANDAPRAELHELLRATCLRAKEAGRALAPLGRKAKDAGLEAIAERLTATSGPLARFREAVLRANEEDLARGREAGLSDALLDRLALDGKRLDAIAKAVREIIAMDDPVGEVLGLTRRPNGLTVGQVRIPLGVIAMIYEARPNVTVDAAALCLKSGNAVLLRGGKEAARSNAELGALVRDALASGICPRTPCRSCRPSAAKRRRSWSGLTGLIDLVIPRGGEGLIRFVAEHARVPVIQHYKGVCHLYVDEGADSTWPSRSSRTASSSARACATRSSACSCTERRCRRSCRGWRARPSKLELRGDEAVCALLPGATPATPDDWGQEFLAPILAVRVVGSLDEALAHIAAYGSNHTEAICTPSYARRSASCARSTRAACW
jgi:glutamate-5-semialdehyde dehydrogenase